MFVYGLWMLLNKNVEFGEGNIMGIVKIKFLGR